MTGLFAIFKKADLPCSEEEFAARCGAHADRLNEYYQHLVGVEQDKTNDSLKPDERRVAFPPPEAADPRVRMAVVTSGKLGVDAVARPSYEIVRPTLDEKKAALHARVEVGRAAAVEGVIPAAKRQHWAFRQMDIHAADHKRVQDAPLHIDDVPRFVRETRSADDTAFLAEHAERLSKEGAIQRHAAKLSHDIHDLTEENVDAFEIGAFHG